MGPGQTGLMSHLPLIYINVRYPLVLKSGSAAPDAAPDTFPIPDAMRRITMRRTNGFSIKPITVAGVASVLLGFAAVTFSPAPAQAVVYCQYVDYPPSCVARAGVVLRPRPVARAAVRANTAGGNLNGGVNRVGVRR